MRRPGLWRGVATRWADTGLAAKGLVVVAMPLVILLTGVAALHLSSQAEVEAEEAVRRTFAIQRDIHEVHALLAEAASGVRGYRLTGREEFLDPYRKAEALLPATLDRIKRSVRDEEVISRLARVDVLVIKKRQGLAQLAAMPGAGRSSGRDRGDAATRSRVAGSPPRHGRRRTPALPGRDSGHGVDRPPRQPGRRPAAVLGDRAPGAVARAGRRAA
jgi:hypothetical protein